VAMSIENTNARLWLALGAFNGALSVALGAFAAHALSGRLTERFLSAFEKGVEYQGMHAFALLVVGLLLLQQPQGRLVQWAGWLFLGGILLFSGSLYALALSGVSRWGVVTPFGGTAFLLGWVLLGVGAWKSKPGG
jgi:uncharacterized membrane protein YgdD (TMEM256/DUF423 family)